MIGPYVITTNDPAGATVSAVGATMFADAGGSSAIANGAVVPTGTPIWLASSAVGSATLTAVAQADVPSGNVYLYSGNIANVDDAQKLILAQSVTVTANATAPAEFTQPTPTTPTTPTSDPTTSAVAPTTTSSATTAVVAPTATGTIPQTGSNATETRVRRCVAADRGRSASRTRSAAPCERPPDRANAWIRVVVSSTADDAVGAGAEVQWA